MLLFDALNIDSCGKHQCGCRGHDCFTNRHLVYYGDSSRHLLPEHTLVAYYCLINSFPNNIFLGLSKLKGFADDRMNVTEKLKFLLGRVENIVEKGENDGYQHFLLFPQGFQKLSSPVSFKVGLCCKELILSILTGLKFCHLIKVLCLYAYTNTWTSKFNGKITPLVMLIPLYNFVGIPKNY